MTLPGSACLPGWGAVRPGPAALQAPLIYCSEINANMTRSSPFSQVEWVCGITQDCELEDDLAFCSIICSLALLPSMPCLPTDHGSCYSGVANMELCLKLSQIQACILFGAVCMPGRGWWLIPIPEHGAVSKAVLSLGQYHETDLEPWPKPDTAVVSSGVPKSCVMDALPDTSFVLRYVPGSWWLVDLLFAD